MSAHCAVRASVRVRPSQLFKRPLLVRTKSAAKKGSYVHRPGVREKRILADFLSRTDFFFQMSGIGDLFSRATAAGGSGGEMDLLGQRKAAAAAAAAAKGRVELSPAAPFR